MRGRLVHGVVLVDAVMILLAVLLHDLVFLLVQSNLTQERFLVPLLTQSLPTAAYSALVGCRCCVWPSSRACCAPRTRP